MVPRSTKPPARKSTRPIAGKVGGQRRKAKADEREDEVLSEASGGGRRGSATPSEEEEEAEGWKKAGRSKKDEARKRKEAEKRSEENDEENNKKQKSSKEQSGKKQTSTGTQAVSGAGGKVQGKDERHSQVVGGVSHVGSRAGDKRIDNRTAFGKGAQSGNPRGRGYGGRGRGNQQQEIQRGRGQNMRQGQGRGAGRSALESGWQTSGPMGNVQGGVWAQGPPMPLEDRQTQYVQPQMFYPQQQYVMQQQQYGIPQQQQYAMPQQQQYAMAQQQQYVMPPQQQYVTQQQMQQDRQGGMPIQVASPAAQTRGNRGGSGIVPSQAPTYSQVIQPKQLQQIDEWVQDEKYCMRCKSFMHSKATCDRREIDKPCGKCSSKEHVDVECPRLMKTEEDKILKVTGFQKVHPIEHCKEQKCVCMACIGREHCEVNCVKRVEEEKKCQFCNRTGHGVEACLWKLTIKGHARADGMVNMLRVMRATTLTPKDEATRKDKEWKDKVNQMRKLESWLEWFLDEGQRVFWIGCTTVVRNSPELVNELQAINTAIAYTVEKLRGKMTIWKKAMSGTTTPNQYRKERVELQADLALYTAAVDLWMTVCNKMRPNEPRIRIWTDLFQVDNNAAIYQYYFVEKLAALAAPADEADNSEEMAAYLPIWVLGKIELLMEFVALAGDEQGLPGFWNMMKETVLFLEHLGLDRWIGPRMIWFDIGNKSDKVRIFQRGMWLIQQLAHAAIALMGNLRSKVTVGLEAVGAVWMWVWIFVATPLVMTDDIAQIMVATHYQIEQINRSLTNSFLQGEDMDNLKETENMSRLMGQITEINEELKGAVDKVTQKTEMGKSAITVDTIVAMNSKLSDKKKLEGKATETVPKRTGLAIVRARGKKPLSYTLVFESRLSHTLVRERSEATIYSEVIGALTTEHSNSYNIRMGMLTLKVGPQRMAKFETQSVRERTSERTEEEFEKTWVVEDAEADLVIDECFREYWTETSNERSEIIVLAGEFPKEETGGETETVELVTASSRKIW